MKFAKDVSTYRVSDLFDLMDNSRVDHIVMSLVDDLDILHEVEQSCKMTNTVFAYLTIKLKNLNLFDYTS